MFCHIVRTEGGSVKIRNTIEIVRIMSEVLLAVSIRHSPCFVEEVSDMAVFATEVVEAAWSKDLHMTMSHTRRMAKGKRLRKDITNIGLM